MAAIAKFIESPQERPLGLIWIDSPYPMLSLGLEKALAGEAYIYSGTGVPKETPSLIILCQDDGDIASRLHRLQTAAPDTPALVFGYNVSAQAVREALRVGARGFIHARMKPEQIARSISLVCEKGEIVVPREVLTDLVAGESKKAELLDLLTNRQREILELVEQGLTNAQIAKQLYLAEFTIKQHLRHAYKTLGVRNRTEAARLIRNSNH